MKDLFYTPLFWIVIFILLLIFLCSQPTSPPRGPEGVIYPPEDEIADPTGRGWH